MRLVLALFGLGLLTVALPAEADPLVDCSVPAPGPALWFACYRFWAEVDAGYCLRADDAAGCVLDEAPEAYCTLDAPPSRCGNAMVAFGFRA